MLTWLAAAVAFSLSMIVFSTIVSALTEFVHRFFHLREAGLRRMLEQLYVRHIGPTLLGDGGDLSKTAKGFSDSLTRSLAIPRREGWRKYLGWPGHWYAPRRVQSLPWLEFIRRLAESETGERLGARAQGELDRVIGDLAVRYERFGADATAYFRERAQAVSISLAFGVAIALNIDAVRLFSTFLTDRALTEQVIRSADQIVGAYQTQAKATAEAVQDQPTADKAALDASLEHLRETLDSPLIAGLPIGYALYPFCQDPNEKLRDPRCGDDLRSKPRTFLPWALRIALAGFLIGLGGPFWFDAYTKLASLLGNARPPAKPASDSAVAAEAEPPPDPSKPPPGMAAPPAEAFKAALATSAAPRARAVLDRAGLPLG